MSTRHFWNQELRSLIFSNLILCLGVYFFHWSLGPTFFLIWLELVIQAAFLLLKLRRMLPGQRGSLTLIVAFFYTPLLVFLFLLVQRLSADSWAYPWSVWVSGGLMFVSGLWEQRQPVTLASITQEVLGRALALSIAGMIGYGIWQATNSVELFVVLFTVTAVGLGLLFRFVQWRYRRG